MEDVAKSTSALLNNKHKAYLYAAENKALDQYHLQSSLSLATDFIKAFESLPILFIAQLYWFDKSNEQSTQLSYHLCLWLCFLCRLNHIHPAVSRQIVAAALLAHTLSTKKRDKLIGQFADKSSHIWQKLFRYFHIQHSSLFKLAKHGVTEPFTAVAILARLLTSMIWQGSQHQDRNLHQILSQLLQHCHVSIQPLLSPILCRFQGCLPGMMIKLKHDQSRLILACGEQRLWVVPTQDKNQPATEVALSDIEVCCYPQVAESEQYVFTHLAQHLAKLANEVTLPAQLPNLTPAEQIPELHYLLQATLAGEEADISKVEKQLADNPLMAIHLQITASQTVRQDLKVDSLRQAIVSQGLLGTSEILKRHLLMQQLNQTCFPLQQDLVQFVQLCCYCSAQLAAISMKSTEIQGIQSFILFSLSGLFLHKPLKIRMQWLPQYEDRYLINSLVNDGADLHAIAIKQMRQWQQPKEWIDMIESNTRLPEHLTLNNSTDTGSLILGTTLILCQQIFFEYELDLNSREYLQQSSDLLGIQNIEQWLLEYAMESGVHRQLRLR
jgi:hypothetical protein